MIVQEPASINSSISSSMAPSSSSSSSSQHTSLSISESPQPSSSSEPSSSRWLSLRSTINHYYTHYAIFTFLSVALVALIPIIICVSLYSTQIQNTALKFGGVLTAFLFEIMLIYSVRYIQQRLVTPMHTYVNELQQYQHKQEQDQFSEGGGDRKSNTPTSLFFRWISTRAYHSLLLCLVYLSYVFLLLVLIFCILGSFVSMGRIIPLASSPDTVLYDPPLWSTIALSCFGIGIQMLWITIAGDIGFLVIDSVGNKIIPYFRTLISRKSTLKVLSTENPTVVPNTTISTPTIEPTVKTTLSSYTSPNHYPSLSVSCGARLSSVVSCCSRNWGICLRGNCKPFPFPLAVFLYVSILIACITGLVQGHAFPTLKYTTIPLARFPSSLNGFRIAVITDTHIGPAIGGTKIAYAVDLALSSSPDIVVLVGDIIDGDEVVMRPALEAFRRLGQACNGTLSSSSNTNTNRPCQAVYYVSGNHCSDIGTLRDKILLFQHEYGITVLHNKLVPVGFVNTSTTDTFDLVGVPDWSISRTTKDEVNAAPTKISLAYPSIDPSVLAQHDLLGTVKNRNTSRELVVLAHQPAHGTQAAAVGTGLLISGHVHGGQFTPIHLLAKGANKFFRGLETATREETDLSNPQPMYAYTSYGTYQWGPLFRQFAPNEVSVLELVRI